MIGLVSHGPAAPVGRRTGRPGGDAAPEEAPADFAALLAQVAGVAASADVAPADAPATPAAVDGPATGGTIPTTTAPDAGAPPLPLPPTEVTAPEGTVAPEDGTAPPAPTTADPGPPPGPDAAVAPPTLPAGAPHGLQRRLEAPGAEHRSTAAPIVPPGHARRAADEAPAEPVPPATDEALTGAPAAPATPAVPHDDRPAEPAGPADPADPALPAVAADGRLHRPEAPGAAAPTAPPPVAGPVHEQVAVRLRDLRLDDGADQSLTIDLHPAELGAVTVDLRMSDGTVHVTVRAEEPAAARLLEHHLDDLGTALDAGGLEVGELRMAPPEPPAPPPSTPGERDVLDRRRHRPDDDRPADPRPDRHDGVDLAFDALL